jgi:hypothetical protein
MNETIGQGGEMATMPPRRIGEILSAAFQLYRRHWRTLLAIAAVVVVPPSPCSSTGSATGSAPTANSSKNRPRPRPRSGSDWPAPNRAPGPQL